MTRRPRHVSARLWAALLARVRRERPPRGAWRVGRWVMTEGDVR